MRFGVAAVAALFLLSGVRVEAQTTSLSPLPIQHFVDNNGNLCVGCKLFTYQAGTTTKQATYTDSTGGTPNTNPVVMNARGEANVWLDPTLSYKFVLSPSTDSDPPTDPIWTVDQISEAVASAQLTAALASPPPIGSTAPNTGAFTTLSATGAAALAGQITAGSALTWPSTLYNIGLVGALDVTDPRGVSAIVSSARSSDNTGLVSAHAITNVALVVHDKASFTGGVWDNYWQVVKASGADNASNVYGLEGSVLNLSSTVATADPYTDNPSGGIYGIRLDAGIGSCGHGSPELACGNDSTAAIQIVQNSIPASGNSTSFRSGIIIAGSALDTLAGRVAPGLAMPQNVAVDWYSAASNIAWQMWSSASGGNNTIELTNTSFNLSSNLGLAGALTTTSTSGPQISINTAVGFRQIGVFTSGLLRWQFGANAVAESGTNAGSNFEIDAYDDSGSFLSSPLKITRSTGDATFAAGIVASLPTSCSGKPSGAFWNNSGVVNLCP